MRAEGVLSIALMETPSRSLSNEFLPKLRSPCEGRNSMSNLDEVLCHFYVNDVNGYEMTSINYCYPLRLKYRNSAESHLDFLSATSLWIPWSDFRKCETDSEAGNTSKLVSDQLHRGASSPCTCNLGGQLSPECLCREPETPGNTASSCLLFELALLETTVMIAAVW